MHTQVLVPQRRCGASGGLMLAAFPAQTIALGVTIGGLYYAGDRQYRDLPLNPFEKLRSPLPTKLQLKLLLDTFDRLTPVIFLSTLFNRYL